MDYQLKKVSCSDVRLFQDLLSLWQLEDGIINAVLPGQDYLLQLLSKDTFHLIVALSENTVIGGLTAFEIPTYFKEGTEMFLYEIGVDKKYRQKGIATAMIEMLIEICKERAIQELYVGTEVENLAAQKLYSSTGGKKEDVVWFTYRIK
ncbi:MAG: GNAT family N-acetyltransferase [Chitinophagaceae bacterium]|nr:GNAT family N-acetyltransferase [Chitinophagaceae bacterium]